MDESTYMDWADCTPEDRLLNCHKHKSCETCEFFDNPAIHKEVI